MFKTKSSKILGFVALFLLIIFSWVMINDARHKKLINTPADNGIQNPFGESSEDVDLPGGGKKDNTVPTPTDSNTGVAPTPIPSDNITIVEDNPVLKKLSKASVAGFTFVTEEREIPEDKATTTDASIVETYDFSGYKTIRFGDKADEVVAIKTVLNRQTPNLALVINTEYDTDMKNAIIDFQNKNGLTGDGIIGGKTYAKLNAVQGIKTYSGATKPKNIEVVPMVRYVDAGSGILFDKPTQKKEDERRITNNSIPRVAEAFFDNSGTKVVLRYLKDDVIQTYVETLTFPKIDPNLTQVEKDAIPKIADVKGDFLPEGILTLAVSREGKNFFYMNPLSGGSAGIVYNFIAKTKKQIFETPLTEWIGDFAGESKINITTKASGQADGYSYSLDAKTSSYAKNVGGKLGLTTLMSPDGKKILYAEYAANKITTSIMDLGTGKVATVSPSTLPEKCIWTKDSKKIYCAAVIRPVAALYPDDWYMGKISFDDALWVIDPADYSGNIIYDFLGKSGQHLDATNLHLNADESYLGFINKKDGTLWGFDLAR